MHLALIKGIPIWPLHWLFYVLKRILCLVRYGGNTIIRITITLYTIRNLTEFYHNFEVSLVVYKFNLFCLMLKVHIWIFDFCTWYSKKEKCLHKKKLSLEKINLNWSPYYGNCYARFNGININFRKAHKTK